MFFENEMQIDEYWDNLNYDLDAALAEKPFYDWRTLAQEYDKKIVAEGNRAWWFEKDPRRISLEKAPFRISDITPDFAAS